MNLFDCQFLSNPSVKHHYPENEANIEYIDHMEISNTRTDSTNNSSASAPEVFSPQYPATNIQRRPEKKMQKAIYKGPDVFGKVLGPTADESILVGLQALMDMAGTLEFSSFTPGPSTNNTPVDSPSKESREVSEPVSQSSASGQRFAANHKEKTAFSTNGISEEFNHEIINEVRRNPYNYIITQENISAAVNSRRSKCQHSQTRVLPTSMTCYNPDGTDCPSDRFSLNVPCPNLMTPKPPLKSRFQSFSPPQSSPRQLPSTASPTAPPNCPCSQFYHQMTTISLVENSPEDAPTCLPRAPKRTACELLEQPTLIFPDTVNVAVDVSSMATQKKRSVGSEPTKEIISKPIQTLPLRKPKLKHANVETDSATSQDKISVACDCNFHMPISAGLSKPPSRVSNVCKIISSIHFSDQMGSDCACPACCSPEEIVVVKGTEQKVLPIVKNKSCSCYLMTKGVRLADAAISSLKVNTSCQYHISEIAPIESRSTQCGKLNHRHDSFSQLCSESGDCQPHRKKSVRILGGPYECLDFSETRYCMEPTNSRSVIPLLDCNGDTSKVGFEKPARVCLEMGDSFISPPMEVRYAITKITKFRDFSTFEVMKSTSKKPKCMPKAVEGVFVLKKEENYCSSKTFE